MSHGLVFRAGKSRQRRAGRGSQAISERSIAARRLLCEQLEDRRVLSLGAPLLAAPLVDAGPDATASEGSLFTGAGSVNDVGSQSWSGTVNYGDGSPTETLAIGADRTFLLSHVYGDNGVYPVTVTVTDDEALKGVDTVQVTVNNVSPSLYVCGRKTVTEGAVLSLPNMGMFTDPGFTNAPGGTAETFSYSINWGDGSAVDTGSATVSIAGASGKVTRGVFDGTHTYADDGQYTVALTVQDDDGGTSLTRLVTVAVTNAPPVVTNLSLDKTAILETESVSLTGTFTDAGSHDTHTAVIDWGDGTTSDAVVDAASRTFTAQHQYLDSPATTPPQFKITATVTDNGNSAATQSVFVTVNPAPPVVNAGTDQATNEGQAVTFAGSFTDASINDTHTIAWDFGDGKTETGSLTPTHVYGDNGTYTVKLTVTDSDRQSATDTLTVTVANVAPTLTVPGAQTVAEGAVLNLAEIGLFTDPGFTQVSAATHETFTYSIDWGDGTAASAGNVTAVTQGAAGTLTNGTVSGAHIYGDDGNYTVKVIVADDDGGTDTKSFTVTVTNVAPTLTVAANQTTNEGTALTVTNIGALTDPGFANPLNPGAERDETFTYTINWGDGTAASTGAVTIDRVGSAGTPTAGSLDGLHTYADNGTYPVTVTVTDDDGGTTSQSLQITVNNVAPTLGVIGNQQATVATALNLTDIGVLTDPGFANPLNPGDEKAETFTYTINWGDNTVLSSGAVTIDQAGSAGVLTGGSFNGSHTYSTAGTYTVTVHVADDDGGTDEEQFDIVVAGDAEGQSSGSLAEGGSGAASDASAALAVSAGDEASDSGGLGEETAQNEPPFVWGPGNLTIDEGPMSMPPLGSFLDMDSSGPFNYSIDWGDGTGVSSGTATLELEGPPSAGSFDSSHVYGDNGVYDLALTVSDEQGAATTEIFEVTVNNVLPQLQGVVVTTPISEGKTATLSGTIVDPGTNDRHVLVVTWGDGKTDTYQYGVGATTFRETHQYANNRPNDAPFAIHLELTDDDAPNDPATADVSVVVKNMPPTAVDDLYMHIGGGDLVVDATLGVLANDTDPGGDALSVSDYGTPSAGKLVGKPDGSFVYTPPSDSFSGVVRFTYTVVDSDGELSANAATVTIDSALRGSIAGFVQIPFATTSFQFANVGIPGVTITLTDATTQEIVQTTTLTGDDGSYHFGGLHVGTYIVTETQPAALQQGGVNSRQIIVDDDVPITGVNFVDGWLVNQTISMRNYFASAPSLASLLTPANLREMVARGEQQAGNGAQAAAIRAGGSQTTVVISGTAGDDTIQFTAGPTHHKVYVNNYPLIFNASEVETFKIDGRGGNDTATVIGSTSADVVVLRPVPATSTVQLPDYTLRGIGYVVSIDNVEHITTEGGGGYDRAYLYDSPGDDLLSLDGASAKLESWGTDDFSLEAIDFDWVHAAGTAGGENAKQLNGAIDFVLETEGQWSD